LNGGSYYLGSNVSDRRLCNMCHPVDTSITWLSGFGLFVDGAWGCKYMFVSLRRLLSLWTGSRQNLDSLTQEEYCGEDHSTGLPDHSYSHDIEKWANVHLKLIFCHCVASLWFCNILEEGIWDNKGLYSLLEQSKPAGHNNAPMRSWWNLQSVLTLQVKGGFKGWPQGVIQSRIAPFKLLVSSDRALAEPFCIYHKLGHINGEWKCDLPALPCVQFLL